jgi:hypothetical protein
LSTFAVVDAGFFVTFWAAVCLPCWTFATVDDDDDDVTGGGKHHSRYDMRTKLPDLNHWLIGNRLPAVSQ